MEGIVVINTIILPNMDLNLNLRGWWLMPCMPPLITLILGLSFCLPRVLLILLGLVRLVAFLPKCLLALNVVQNLFCNVLYLMEVRIW
jgi:hypothetical protein